MSKSDSGSMGVRIALVLVIAACGGLAGCASPGERLPQCKGRAQPINTGPINPLSPRLAEGPVTQLPVTQVPVTQVPVNARGVTDAH